MSTHCEPGIVRETKHKTPHKAQRCLKGAFNLAEMAKTVS